MSDKFCLKLWFDSEEELRKFEQEYNKPKPIVKVEKVEIKEEVKKEKKKR